MSQIWLASCGCWHQAWDSSFYPDDLPPSWRFSYYSNEFQSLYLRDDEWISVDREDLQTWMEDCDERFEFLLQLDIDRIENKEHDLEEVMARLAILSEQVSALVLSGEAVLIKRYRDSLAKVSKAALFYLAIDQVDSALPLAQFVDNASDAIWAKLLIVRFIPPPKLLAQWLKTIVAAGHSGGLIFCSQPPSIDLLRQAEGLLPFLLPQAPAVD